MRVIALDIGTVRTGYAFGDTDIGVATTRSEILSSPYLLKLLESEQLRYGFGLILVGRPSNRHNQDTDISTLVDTVVDSIQAAFPSVKLVTVNERNTTTLAHRNLTSGNINFGKINGPARKRSFAVTQPKLSRYLPSSNHKPYLDNESARIMLQEWLDKHRI